MGLGLHTEVHHLGQPPFFERLPQLLAVAEPSRCAAARKVENIVNSKRLSSPIRSHSHFFGEYKVLNRNFIFHDLIPRTTAIVFDLAKILGAKQNSDILLTSSTYEEEYADFKLFSTSFLWARTPSLRTVSIPFASNSGSVSSGFSYLNPT
jgi:hypothetical protein